MDLRITCLTVQSIPVLQLVLLLGMMLMSYVLVSNDYIYTYVHYILNLVHGSTYSNCTDGQVRLFGGSTDYEGTVEICINNAWGTMSDDYGWGYEESQTICNALGYTAPGIINTIINAECIIAVWFGCF